MLYSPFRATTNQKRIYTQEAELSHVHGEKRSSGKQACQDFTGLLGSRIQASEAQPMGYFRLFGLGQVGFSCIIRSREGGNGKTNSAQAWKVKPTGVATTLQP
ncbi:uncharacterized protein [Symphalangus syndactylus]|uniref:uncharacterized protein n=1 Tax=Symphalangus syndactylus TaxID=9590 RepID=UPI0030055BF9